MVMTYENNSYLYGPLKQVGLQGLTNHSAKLMF